MIAHFSLLVSHPANSREEILSVVLGYLQYLSNTFSLLNKGGTDSKGEPLAGGRIHCNGFMVTARKDL